MILTIARQCETNSGIIRFLVQNGPPGSSGGAFGLPQGTFGPDRGGGGIGRGGSGAGGLGRQVHPDIEVSLSRSVSRGSGEELERTRSKPSSLSSRKQQPGRGGSDYDAMFG